jgi:hypothetical protein
METSGFARGKWISGRVIHQAHPRGSIRAHRMLWLDPEEVGVKTLWRRNSLDSESRARTRCSPWRGRRARLRRSPRSRRRRHGKRLVVSPRCSPWRHRTDARWREQPSGTRLLLLLRALCRRRRRPARPWVWRDPQPPWRPRADAPPPSRGPPSPAWEKKQRNLLNHTRQSLSPGGFFCCWCPRAPRGSAGGTEEARRTHLLKVTNPMPRCSLVTWSCAGRGPKRAG